MYYTLNWHGDVRTNISKLVAAKHPKTWPLQSQRCSHQSFTGKRGQRARHCETGVGKWHSWTWPNYWGYYFTTNTWQWCSKSARCDIHIPTPVKQPCSSIPKHDTYSNCFVVKRLWVEDVQTSHKTWSTWTDLFSEDISRALSMKKPASYRWFPPSQPHLWWQIGRGDPWHCWWIACWPPHQSELSIVATMDGEEMIGEAIPQYESKYDARAQTSDNMDRWAAGEWGQRREEKRSEAKGREEKRKSKKIREEKGSEERKWRCAKKKV